PGVSDRLLNGHSRPRLDAGPLTSPFNSLRLEGSETVALKVSISPYRAAASTHGVETRSQSHRRDRKVARWCLSFGSQGSCVRRGLRALSAEVRRLIEAEKDLELVGELDRLYP